MYKQYELESLRPAGLLLYQEVNSGVDNVSENKNKTHNILESYNSIESNRGLVNNLNT